MTAQVNSPNWHWQRLGYAVERGPRNSRVIRRQDGSIVDTRPKEDEGEDHHAAEIRAALAEHQKPA